MADEILDGGISPLHAERANKCYMADTGLLVESAVAQTLVAKGDRLFFYTQSGLEEGKERMEIDFLVTRPFRDAALKPRSAQSR